MIITIIFHPEKVPYGKDIVRLYIGKLIFNPGKNYFYEDGIDWTRLKKYIKSGILEIVELNQGHL